VAAVELEAVRKAYGGQVAVQDLSLAVESGESVALLGPSGCGKTTTLNMIAGFIDPDAGTIRVAGRPMAGVPPYRRDTGMVFQSYALFPHLTVFDNLAFGLTMRRTPRAEIAGRVREALDLVHLRGLEGRFPRELSGGQQQRVALARALVIRPAVLLLDEPLSNLDARLRQEMRLEIVDIQKRLAITTIFVTHDQEEALVIADRVAVMDRGRIEQVDTPERIYGRPRTHFVARFIGEANFLPGRVVEATASTLGVETEWAGRVHVASEGATDGPARVGDRVLVMVRPEKVRLSREPGGGDNALEAVVRATTFLGAVTRYQLVPCSAPPGEAFVAALPDASHLAGVAPGDRVHAGWRAADCLALPGGDARAT
jgi:ABC-type Fe3+/spermidine/putrescine transport system ATPase subunit